LIRARLSENCLLSSGRCPVAPSDRDRYYRFYRSPLRYHLRNRCPSHDRYRVGFRQGQARVLPKGLSLAARAVHSLRSHRCRAHHVLMDLRRVVRAANFLHPPDLEICPWILPFFERNKVRPYPRPVCAVYHPLNSSLPRGLVAWQLLLLVFSCFLIVFVCSMNAWWALSLPD